MEEHRNMFFTMWYGVYCKSTRLLTYSSGGHPPAVLISGESAKSVQTRLLKTPGLVVGGLPQASYTSDSVQVGPHNKLFIFSDGVYELASKDGMAFLLDDLVKVIAATDDPSSDDIERIIAFSSKINEGKPFPDDFSVVKVIFK
jgi:sigma-B regulation protein RsbU (phosphoserine phosphatase)